MKSRNNVPTLIFIFIVLLIVCSCTSTPKTKEQREDVQPEVLLQLLISGDYVEVKSLVEAGANVNAQNHAGATALIVASQFGNKEIAELLIKAGANVNARMDSGNTALTVAGRCN